MATRTATPTDPVDLHARGDQLKPATGTSDTVSRSLAKKLSEVMGELRNIPKLGHNRVQNYDYVRDQDVSEAASKLLAERGIWYETSVIKAKTKPLYTTQNGLTMWLTRVWVEYYFVDGETGATTPPRRFPGDGADTGDKSLPKALTNANKYFLLKSFMISTGDDPEADEKIDKAAAAAAAGSSGVRIARGAQPGVQRGGRSANATEVQVREIAKLARGLGFDAESVVAIAEKLLDIKMPEDKTIREWLGTLTGEQAASIITALMAVEKPAESSTELSTAPETVDDSEEPPAISIV